MPERSTYPKDRARKHEFIFNKNVKFIEMCFKLNDSFEVKIRYKCGESFGCILRNC